MNTNKKLGQAAIATGAGTLIYTVPSQYKAEIKDIDIANTTAGALTVAIHLVPSGGSASTSNMLFPGINLDAKTLIQWTGNQILNSGDFIQGIGSGSGITVNITGSEDRA